ncbi:MAG: hypothetical protein J6X44_14165 [Thermoguttaceae bacterium]|nr:hypothetical protein [Thermoguttaceae bacterium]
MRRLISAVAALLLATFGFVCSSIGDDGSYVVANPSFEQANDSGGADGWRGNPQTFVVVSEGARSGNACLRWTGDGSKYELCSQNVKIEPGDIIEFSVWVKTKDLKGGRATICVEWSRQDGTWYGGGYTQGANGTNADWVKVSGHARVPEDATSPHVTVYVSESGSGTAWFDDVEITRYNLPLFTAMTTDRYRAQAVDGTVDVFVGYTKTTKNVDFKALKPELTVNGEDGAGTSATFVEAGDDYYRFSFDSSKLSDGKYTLTASMVDPNTKKLETISTPFTKLDKFPERVSYIDENLRLIHNGEPFFPLGLYLSGANENEIKLLGDSPFNCVMPYQSIRRETVDALLDAGLYTIYSVKDNYPTLNSATMEEGNQKTERTVTALKDCPGVIAWYINDELPSSMVKDLAARRDQMEALDPGRPTWVVLYQVDELRMYLSTYDVVGSDPYPISSKEPSLAADWTQKTMSAGFGKRAVWQVPQIFNWASYTKSEREKKESRAPTYEEMRGMSWMCVVNGANGLIFYSFFDLFKMDKTVDQGGQALVREPFDERWGEVKKIAQEIRDQFPILLSVGETLDVQPTDASSEDAIYRLYGADEGTWILVVNKSQEPCRAEFAIPEGSKIVETRLGSPATQEGTTVRVELGGLEPRLILVK